ncbi:MAG TPA: polysaccharide deacetylase family protein [Coriobacteriia bacterium]
MTKPLGIVLLFVLTNGSLLLLFPFSIRRLVLTALLYASGTAVMLVILFDPHSRWLLDRTTEVPCNGHPCVALTFDDGPSSDVTPRVLDILRDKKVPATFFLVGREVERNPGLARRMRHEGHVIGNHTYSHPPLFCFLSPWRLRDEIEKAQEAIFRATGDRPRHFRSPVGLRHPVLKLALERAALEFVLWQLRTYDTWALTSDTLRRRILEQVRPGSIVLMHDRSGPGADAMVAALPDVIDGLRARGYELVTL